MPIPRAIPYDLCIVQQVIHCQHKKKLVTAVAVVTTTANHNDLDYARICVRSPSNSNTVVDTMVMFLLEQSDLTVV